MFIILIIAFFVLLAAVFEYVSAGNAGALPPGRECSMREHRPMDSGSCRDCEYYFGCVHPRKR
jgi:hypothetical protein